MANRSKEVEINTPAGSTGSVPTDADSSIIRKYGIPVHHGTTRSTLDVVEFIRAQRDARHARLAGLHKERTE